MHWSFFVQKIFLLGGYLILGIVAPWWIFIPMVIVGLVWKQIGPEIIFVTMMLDMTSGGNLFALWYSFVALALYLGIYGIQNMVMR